MGFFLPQTQEKLWSHCWLFCCFCVSRVCSSSITHWHSLLLLSAWSFLPSESIFSVKQYSLWHRATGSLLSSQRKWLSLRIRVNKGQDFLWKRTHRRVDFYFEVNGRKGKVKPRRAHMHRNDFFLCLVREAWVYREGWGRVWAGGCRSASSGMLQPLDTSLRACSGDLQSGQSPPNSCHPDPSSGDMEHHGRCYRAWAAVFAIPSPHPGLAGAAEGPGVREQSRLAACPGQELLLPWVGTGWAPRAALGHHPPACTHSWDPSPALASRGAEIQKRGRKRRMARWQQWALFLPPPTKRKALCTQRGWGLRTAFCSCLFPRWGRRCAHRGAAHPAPGQYWTGVPHGNAELLPVKCSVQRRVSGIPELPSLLPFWHCSNLIWINIILHKSVWKFFLFHPMCLLFIFFFHESC